MTNAALQLKRATLQIPNVTSAHWLLRLPLAFVILNQAWLKVPLTTDDAASFGLPFILWAMASFGEFAAGAALIVGGFFRNWVGDLLTRVSGFGIAAIVLGVIYVVYWAPVLDILLYNQLHVLLLVGGLYFMLTGNGSRTRKEASESDVTSNRANEVSAE